MGGQILGVGQSDDMTGHVLEGGLGVVDDVNTPQERLHRQSTGVTRATGGGQHVVGPGAVITEADRRPRTDENCSGGTDPGRHCRGVGGLNLQVLSGVGIDHPHTGVNIINEHDRRLLSGQRRGDPFTVHGGG